MQRYAISQFDGSTYQVVDLVEQREICVCSDYDDWEDAKERAEIIVILLNAYESWSKKAAIFGFPLNLSNHLS